MLLTFRVNFDENAMQLDATEIRPGYEKAYQHKGVNEVAPEYLIVTADHDMRNTNDLAALDQIAERITKLPDVAYVRGADPPGRKPARAEHRRLPGRCGRRSPRFGPRPRRRRAPGSAAARASGTSALRDGAATADAQLPQLVTGIKQVTALAHEVLGSYESANAALATATGAPADLDAVLADLNSSVNLLDVALRVLSQNTQVLDAGRTMSAALGPALAVEARPDCLANPICARARAGIADLDAISGGTVGRALRQVQLATAMPQETIDRLRAAEPAIRNTVARLQKLAATAPGDSPSQSRARLDELVRWRRPALRRRLGTGGRSGSGQGGVDQVVGLTGQLSDRLSEATDYLATLSAHTSDGPGAGFYLPPPGTRRRRLPRRRTVAVRARREDRPPAGDLAGQPRTVLRRWMRPSSYRWRQVRRPPEPRWPRRKFASTGLASLSADMRDQVWRDFAVYGAVAIFGVLLVADRCCCAASPRRCSWSRS